MKRFKFKKFNNIGKEEIAAVNKVVRSGVLSKYLGERKKDFLGGKFVNIFEKKWSNYFNVKYSAAVNSWSSGLVCCVGSLDIEPGDEIILPSITMTACAAAILTWNAIPVFADVDPRTYSISIKSIKKNLSKLCEIEINKINVKAKTTDNIGIIGKNRALATEVISVLQFN